MTAQEAYAELISIRKNREDGYLTHLSYSGKADEQEEYTIKAYSVAIEALDKQIPKKLKDDGWLYCPICGRDVLMDRFNYCPDCGQALDWSENND